MAHSRKEGIDCNKKKPLKWAKEHIDKWKRAHKVKNKGNNEDETPESIVGFCINDKKNTITGIQLEALIDAVKALSGENYTFYIEINDEAYYNDWKLDNAECLKNVRLTNIHEIQKNPYWESFNTEYAKLSGELEVSLAGDVKDCLDRQPLWEKVATEKHCRLTAKYIGNMMLAENKDDNDTLTFIWYPNKFSGMAKKVVEFVLKNDAGWNVKANILHFHFDINNLEGIYQQKQSQRQQQDKRQTVAAESVAQAKIPVVQKPESELKSYPDFEGGFIDPLAFALSFGYMKELGRTEGKEGVIEFLVLLQQKQNLMQLQQLQLQLQQLQLQQQLLLQQLQSQPPMPTPTSQQHVRKGSSYSAIVLGLPADEKLGDVMIPSTHDSVLSPRVARFSGAVPLSRNTSSFSAETARKQAATCSAEELFTTNSTAQQKQTPSLLSPVRQQS